MERYDLYDRDRKKLGRTGLRGESMSQEGYRLFTHVVVFHPQGQMLIQKRQPWAHTWPDLWDLSVGGGVIAGENTRQAAEREAMEELGLELDLSQAIPALTLSFAKGFDDLYLVTRELDPEKLILQPEEVQSVRWAEQEEIHAMIRAGSFVPYHDGLIDLLFETHRIPGSHQSQRGRRR